MKELKGAIVIPNYNSSTPEQPQVTTIKDGKIIKDDGHVQVQEILDTQETIATKPTEQVTITPTSEMGISETIKDAEGNVISVKNPPVNPVTIQQDSNIPTPISDTKQEEPESEVEESIPKSSPIIPNYDQNPSELTQPPEVSEPKYINNQQPLSDHPLEELNKVDPDPAKQVIFNKTQPSITERDNYPIINNSTNIINNPNQ